MDMKPLVKTETKFTKDLSVNFNGSQHFTGFLSKGAPNNLRFNGVQHQEADPLRRSLSVWSTWQICSSSATS